MVVAGKWLMEGHVIGIGKSLQQGFWPEFTPQQHDSLGYVQIWGSFFPAISVTIFPLTLRRLAVRERRNLS